MLTPFITARTGIPRELFLIPGAYHMELYDKPQYVTPAVVKQKEFFGKALR